MSAKPGKYPGKLGRPINLVDQQFSSKEVYQDELIDRLRALRCYYEIDPKLPGEEAWCQLALSLAMDHVPGFQTTKLSRTGAPQKWTWSECHALVAAINAKKQKGIKIKGAIASAMKEPDWKWGKNIKSIQVRYSEVKRRIDRGLWGDLMDTFSRKRITKKQG